MTEVIRHAFGFCGEHWHPNLWTLLLGGFGITTIFSYVILYVKCRINKALAYTQNTWQKLIK